MNAFDESLASNSEHLAGTHPPPFAPTAEPQGRAPGSSIDSWLLTRLRAFLGDPPVEFAVRGRALVGPSEVAPVARVTFANRRTLMPILADPALRFGDAYAEGSVAIDGDLVSLLEAVYRSGAAAGRSASLLTRARGALRLAATMRNSCIRSGSFMPKPTNITGLTAKMANRIRGSRRKRKRRVRCQRAPSTGALPAAAYRSLCGTHLPEPANAGSGRCGAQAPAPG